jgi:hypothetical protein
MVLAGVLGRRVPLPAPALSGLAHDLVFPSFVRRVKALLIAGVCRAGARQARGEPAGAGLCLIV